MKNLLQSELRKLIYLRANWLLLIWSGLFAALGTVAPIMVLNSENNRMGFSGTNTPEGITKPPKGSADPLCFVPANSGGNTEPKLIAVIGSIGCESNQRPNHPVIKWFCGEPVCQIAIDEKCERSGFG